VASFLGFEEEGGKCWRKVEDGNIGSFNAPIAGLEKRSIAVNRLIS